MSVARELIWDAEEEHHEAADALGGRYIVYELAGNFYAVWMFGTSTRRLHSIHSVIKTTEQAKRLAQQDFEKIVSSSLVNYH